MMVMRPYFTDSWTLAPSSMSLERTPEAVMLRVSPLQTRKRC